MTLSRRMLLGASALVPLAMIGCTSGGPTPVQVVSDVNAVVQSLQKANVGLAVLMPPLIPPAAEAIITVSLASAATLGNNLSASASATATGPVIAQIVGLVNTTVDTLATIPGIPSPYSQYILAASVLLPIIEAFAAPYLPAAQQAPVAAVSRAQIAAPMSPDQARAMLAGYLAAK